MENKRTDRNKPKAGRKFNLDRNKNTKRNITMKTSKREMVITKKIVVATMKISTSGEIMGMIGKKLREQEIVAIQKEAIKIRHHIQRCPIIIQITITISLKMKREKIKEIEDQEDTNNNHVSRFETTNIEGNKNLKTTNKKRIKSLVKNRNT